MRIWRILKDYRMWMHNDWLYKNDMQMCIYLRVWSTKLIRIGVGKDKTDSAIGNIWAMSINASANASSMRAYYILMQTKIRVIGFPWMMLGKTPKYVFQRVNTKNRREISLLEYDAWFLTACDAVCVAKTTKESQVWYRIIIINSFVLTVEIKKI